jgi:hypothetical protein
MIAQGSRKLPPAKLEVIFARTTQIDRGQWTVRLSDGKTVNGQGER